MRIVIYFWNNVKGLENKYIIKAILKAILTKEFLNQESFSLFRYVCAICITHHWAQRLLITKFLLRTFIYYSQAFRSSSRMTKQIFERLYFNLHIRHITKRSLHIIYSRTQSSFFIWRDKLKPTQRHPTAMLNVPHFSVVGGKLPPYFLHVFKPETTRLSAGK